MTGFCITLVEGLGFYKYLNFKGIKMFLKNVFTARNVFPQSMYYNLTG